jgi:hypothetical protein
MKLLKLVAVLLLPLGNWSCSEAPLMAPAANKTESAPAQTPEPTAVTVSAVATNTTTTPTTSAPSDMEPAPIDSGKNGGPRRTNRAAAAPARPPHP